MSDAEPHALIPSGRCCVMARVAPRLEVYLDSRGLTIWCKTHDQLIMRLTPADLARFMQHPPECECCKAERPGAVMNFGVPPGMDLRPDVTVNDLLEELTKHANLLIFGREERGDTNEPGTSTAFRAVVIVGAAVGMAVDGAIRPAVFGLLNADGSRHGMACRPKIIRKLREIADDLEEQLEAEAGAEPDEAEFAEARAKGPLS